MKKTSEKTARRSLTLDRQIIRQLSTDELGHAAGGSVTTSPIIPTHYVTCTVHLQE